MPHLRNSIYILNKNNIKIDYKFIPLCLVKGIEDKLANTSQAITDDEEWNYQKRFKVSATRLNYFIAVVKNFKDFSPGQLKMIPFKMLLYMSVLKQNQDKYYMKPVSCKDCRFFNICDGIPNKYEERFGSSEFKPVIGSKIENPIFFRAENRVGKKDYGASIIDIIINIFLYIISYFYNFSTPVIKKIMKKKYYNEGSAYY